MGFTKGVAAGYQRYGLFIIHGHTAKRIADIFGRHDRVGVAVVAEVADQLLPDLISCP